MLSDEAHHLNVLTKNSKNTKQSSEDIEQRTWEHTVNCILQRNKDNILLEFTATCDLNNQNIRNTYKNRIIFDYALTKFYNDKYSKSIETLCSNADETQRILQALIVSQYRLKIFQNNRLSIKPIILFKSKTIKDSSLFISRFHLIIQNLSEKQLQDLSAYANDGILAQAFQYFKDKAISYNALVSELKDEFSTDHCLSVNDESEADKMQLKLNSLEDSTNPYRVIFEVKKLDEGWDVLNLFDIVRMYESKSKTDTISEAQLIGRGARYCPFQIDEEQPKFQRKYDEDAENDLRICETLYYHCQNDAHYISELKKSLRDIGLDLDKMITRKYTLKENFKESKFYRTGKVFSNERRETPRNTINELLPKFRDGLYRFEITSNGVSSDSLMNDNNATNSKQNSLRQKSISIREIANINYAIVNKALMKHPFYCFNTLKSYFPNLDSTRQFITDDHYLGGVNITIRCPEEEPTPTTLYKAVLSVVGKIADALLRIEKTYIGTKVFKENNVRDVFKDKIVHYSSVGTSGDGRGISQNESPTNRLDLSKEDWFVYQDNFGTSEEKAFVCLFKEYAERLQAKYSRVFLVRNERAFHIYSFNNGQRFEPDYILFLQNDKTDGFEQFQIFIEPKGEHLLEKDAWKENLLLSLKKEVEIQPTMIQDNNEYRIWGLHFYNQNRRITAFKKDMESLLDDSLV